MQGIQGLPFDEENLPGAFTESMQVAFQAVVCPCTDFMKRQHRFAMARANLQGGDNACGSHGAGEESGMILGSNEECAMVERICPKCNRIAFLTK